MSKKRSLWQRFKTWLLASDLQLKEPLSFHEQIARAMAGPGNPDNIEVDWSIAPEDAIEWRFDERAQRGYWINGNHRIEEYGIVYDAYPAPDFGANQEAAVKITPAGVALREAVVLQSTTQTAVSTCISRRL